MSSIDWSTVRKVADEGGAAPEGVYNLFLDEATAHKSPKGYEGLKLKLKIEDGPYKDTIIYHYVLLMMEHPKSVPGFLADLNTLGVSDSMLIPGRGMDEIAAHVNQQPRRLRAEIIQDTYQEAVSNKLKRFSRLMPAGGPGSGGAPAFAAPPTTPAPSFAPPAPAPVTQTPPPF